MRLSQVDVDRGKGYVKLTLPEFFALPLFDRIQILLHQRMRFYDEADNLIPLSEGLELLREQHGTAPSAAIGTARKPAAKR